MTTDDEMQLLGGQTRKTTAAAVTAMRAGASGHEDIPIRADRLVAGAEARAGLIRSADGDTLTAYVVVACPAWPEARALTAQVADRGEAEIWLAWNGWSPID